MVELMVEAEVVDMNRRCHMDHGWSITLTFLATRTEGKSPRQPPQTMSSSTQAAGTRTDAERGSEKAKQTVVLVRHGETETMHTGIRHRSECVSQLLLSVVTVFKLKTRRPLSPFT